MDKKKDDFTLLVDQLNEIDQIQNKDWLQSLCERKLKELEFHNEDRNKTIVKERCKLGTQEKFYGNKKYYSITERSKAYQLV